MKKRLLAMLLILFFLGQSFTVIEVRADGLVDVATESDAEEIEDEKSSEEEEFSEKEGNLDDISVQTNVDELDSSIVKNEDRIHYLKIYDASGESNDAILIESNGHFGLIDSSRRYGSGKYESLYFQGSGKAVLNYLEALGVKHLDFFLGTHSHADHLGGIYDIVSGWQGIDPLVDENTTYIYKSYTENTREDGLGWDNWYYYSEAESSMASATKLLVDKHDSGMEKLGAVYCSNGMGDIDDTIDFDFGDFKISLYNLYSRTNIDENANSIVAYIEKDGIKTVLTGDISVYDQLEQKTVKAIVAHHGKVTVMKIPHHGWTKSTSKEFIDVLDAKYAIISTNYVNPASYSPFYGYLKQKGVPIYRTMDVSGKAIVQDMTDGEVVLRVGSIVNSDEGEIVTFDETPTAWNQSGIARWDKWWTDWDDYETVYVNSDGTNKVGWSKIAGHYYYFNNDGFMQTGWTTKDGKRVYLRGSQHYGDPRGSAVTGWEKLDGHWYYFDSEGKGYTGWTKKGIDWFYVDNGLMNTYSARNIDGTIYYFESNGKMKTGWINLGGSWFYLGTNGKIKKGWFLTPSGWYYTNKNGEMMTSQWINDCWLGSNGKWTYQYKGSWNCNETGWWYEDESGWYPQSQWLKINGKKYYFGSDGYMATNEWVDGQWIDGNGYSNYKYKGSWHANSKGWWFGDSSGWYARECWQKINGLWYYFDNDGYMVTNKSIDGYKLGADGACE